MIIMETSRVIGLFVLFAMPALAVWLTAMRAAHHLIQQKVDVINTEIVMSSFTSDTWFRCVSGCTRLTEALSVYYNATSSTCYCNNNTHVNAVADTAESGLIYSRMFMFNIEEHHRAAEKYRYTVPEGNYASCTDLQKAGYKNGGLYYVRNIWGDMFQIYCNMELENWTVFQRRFDGSVDFHRNWTEYVNGFGSSDGEFWLGLEALHQRTSGGMCQLLIYLEAERNNTIETSGYAKYDIFKVGGAETKYALTISEFDGTVGDCLSYADTVMFSTVDADNDAASNMSCAEYFKGGWWYKSCHDSNLNGLYLGGAHISYSDGMEWSLPWGFYYSLIKTEMMFKCF